MYLIFGNYSKPPSSDPNRLKTTRKKSDKSPGAQAGHLGKTLKKTDDPDVIEVISIDRRTLPKGTYHQAGFETRQVFDIDISRVVTEYQAQILEDKQGNRFVAAFPKEVTKAVQYGNQIKAHAVYLSQYQLLPYKRIQNYFADQLQIPLSEGSIYNFNVQAFAQRVRFEQISKDKLAQAYIAHADETGINIKARNLLERLINHEDDVLHFMENPLVPFTNNLGENDIRMTKVQQKISGCFRSTEGEKIFCRVRGYLSTCRKQGITASHALKLVFEGELPYFVA